MKKYNLVFIGCGAICTQIINHLNSYMAEKYDIKMIIDNNVDRATKICEKLNITPVITNKFDGFKMLLFFFNSFKFTHIHVRQKKSSCEPYICFLQDIFYYIHKI